MNTKKGKKENDNTPPPNDNNKKKGKSVVDADLENNLGLIKKEKKREVAEAPPLEGISTKAKVGRKRKQPDPETEFLKPKKYKKPFKEETVSEDELSTSSDVNNVSMAFDTSANLSPKKSKKRKTKPPSTDGTHSFVITDENGGSINIIEMPMQQNGSTKEIKQELGHPSFHVTGESLQYKIEVDNNNALNINATGDSTEDKVVHISIKDLDDTDSDINENDLVTFNKHEVLKSSVSKQEGINWPKEDLKKLVDRMEACVPENDSLAFSTRAEKLQWDTIAFKNYTVEECKRTWFLLQKQIRRYRLLKEVLADAKEWIRSPKPKSKKAPRHPDMPRKPLSAYFIYYMKKRDVYHKSNPGLDATEISKILAQEFKSMSQEKRAKYEKLAALKKEEYEQNLEEFYQTHPDVPRIIKSQRARQERAPKSPKPPRPPKPPKPVKEKAAPKPPKERIPKRPPPPFQFFYLSEIEREGATLEDKVAFKEVCKERWKELHDRKKLVWINYAESEYAKYEEAMQRYVKSHPDYLPNLPHKSILTKEDIQIKERAAGKPNKPPGSAYNLFARMLLQSDEIKSVPVKDRLIYVSNKWKNCAEEEKKQFRDLFTQMNEKYKLEFASYLETLPEDQRKKELQKNVPKRRKSEDVEKVGPSKKRSERKIATQKLVEPEQPPISAYKYFATLYTGEEPVVQAWKALTSEQKKIYEDELVKKKQAYIVNFEKFLNSLTKEELEEFSNSRKRIKKEEDDDDEEEDSSDESGSDDSDDSNDQEDSEEEEEEEKK